jgi:hypothetical protein
MAVQSLVSAAFLVFAVELGVSPLRVGQMLFTIALDLVVGSIPVVGDWFDVNFKSNMINLRVIEAHLEGTVGAALLCSPLRMPLSHFRVRCACRTTAPNCRIGSKCCTVCFWRCSSSSSSPLCGSGTAAALCLSISCI